MRDPLLLFLHRGAAPENRASLFAGRDEGGGGENGGGENGGGGNGGDNDAGDKGGSDKEAGDHEGPERDLGGDRYVRELDRMDRDFRDWMKDHGFEMASGDRDPDSDRHERGTEYHLLDETDTRTSPFGLGVDTSRLSEHTEWIGLAGFVYGQGFIVTSTTGGKHNAGSLHYLGRAVDVRTKDMSAEEIRDFIDEAQNAGIHVRDERDRPEGQQEWEGGHLHLSVPEHWNAPNDRMPFDSRDRSGRDFAPRDDAFDIRRP